ncbi:MAG TPA: glycosyltransferase family protein [Cyclobacteriaceae bacterium]|nr:glycosyltransferase family protein [Cyclobacteriaceae bacterium]
MQIIAVTQARTGSTRLPGKVLKTIGGISLLELHLRRISKSKRITKLVVATTDQPEDQAIVDIAKELGIAYYQGSVNDVLDRFYQSLQRFSADYVVRVTADCPLIDYELVDKVIDFVIDKNLDYGSNTLEPHYPDGQDVEVFKYRALKTAWEESILPSEREHVTPYIWKNSSYKGNSLYISDNFDEGYSFGHLRMTVDEQRDFEVIKQLIEQKGSDGSWLDYATYLSDHANITALNEQFGRNEGYQNSINKDLQ